MARPAKPASMRNGHMTKEEATKRKNGEARLKGKADEIKPPRDLTRSQKAIFNKVVDWLKPAETLGLLDAPLIAQFARCKERIDTIEHMIDNDPNLLLDKDMLCNQDRLFKQLVRLMNELGLSPQSRAKLAISLTKNEEKTTIADILNGEE